jgi:hypothetical protein
MSKSAGNNVKFQDPVSPTIKTASQVNAAAVVGGLVKKLQSKRRKLD